MKPLNQKERNNLFFQFLLFYVISLVVVLFAAFGSIEMNQKQNQLDAQQERDLNLKLRSLRQFIDDMVRVEDIFSKAQSSPDLITLNQKFLNEQASMRTLMTGLPKQDSVLQLQFQSILTGYDIRWNEKKKTLESGDCATQLNQAQNDVASWKKQYNDLVKLYNALGPAKPAQIVPE